MPLAVNDIVAVTYRSLWENQRVLLTMTYRVALTTSTGTVVSDLTQLITPFVAVGATDILTRYRQCLGTDVAIEEVRLQRISPAPRSIYVAGPLSSLPGTGLGPAQTGNVAGTITCRSAIAGRSQIANKHVGPFPTTNMTQGEVDNAQFTALANLKDEFIGPQTVVFGPEQIDLVGTIYHRATTTFDDIFQTVAQKRIGTLRRRTLRVGE